MQNVVQLTNHTLEYALRDMTPYYCHQEIVLLPGCYEICGVNITDHSVTIQGMNSSDGQQPEIGCTLTGTGDCNNEYWYSNYSYKSSSQAEIEFKVTCRITEKTAVLDNIYIKEGSLLVWNAEFNI